jgi:aerobic carbon-monoxide dehydrogenase medium subunit
MFPARFEYHQATGLDDALEVLSAHGSDAKILSGGQSLVPLMKFRLVQPEIVLDINRIPGLGTVREDGDFVVVGALVRHYELETNSVIGRHFPWLLEVAHHVGDTQVRSLGTLAGSLVEADPAGDWSAALLALGATVRVVGPSGTRDVACAEWFTYSFTPAIEDDEIVVEVWIPIPRPGLRGAYRKIEKRKGDFAVAGCAVVADRAAGTARVGLTGVAATPIVSDEAAALLAVEEWSPRLIAQARDAVQSTVRPLADSRGSAAYKRQMAGVMFERAAMALTTTSHSDGRRHV